MNPSPSSHTDLVGSVVLVSQLMNSGLTGVIRHERAFATGEVLFLVEMLDGAAQGSLIELNIRQFKITRKEVEI